MRHVSLTCKNHPNLRWSCKEIAFSPAANGGLGGYNGARNIHFVGEITNPPEFHSDMSGINCILCGECSCPATDLIRSPEDTELEKHDKLKKIRSFNKIVEKDYVTTLWHNLPEKDSWKKEQSFSDALNVYREIHPNEGLFEAHKIVKEWADENNLPLLSDNFWRKARPVMAIN